MKFVDLGNLSEKTRSIEQIYGNSLYGRLHTGAEFMNFLRITAKTDAPQMCINDFLNKTRCESSEWL